MSRKRRGHRRGRWDDTLGLNAKPDKRPQEVPRLKRNACPHCGEDRTTHIITLRKGFKECRSCKKTYIVDYSINWRE